MSNIMEYSGGTAIAMTGTDCVAIASDLRLGEQMTTIGTNVSKIYKLGDRMYTAMCGFQSDATTVLEKLRFRQRLWELRSGREMTPFIMRNVMSNLLYERRFGPYFIEPIIAGLNPDTYKPEIYSMDLIGCVTTPEDFVVTGTAAEQMLGAAEAYWRPNMHADEVWQACGQALLAGLERCANSGWGAVVYVITKDKVVARTLKARQD